MKAQPTRHIVSINDLSNKDIETIFEIAQSYLDLLPGSQFQLPDRPQHRRGVRFHPGQPVLRAEHPHAAVVRERHASARRRHHNQRRSGDQLGGKKAKSLADTVRVIANYADLIVIRHPRDGAAAARRRLFAGPGHQCRRRQPRASDPDPLRPLHPQEEEQAPQEPEDRDLRRPEREAALSTRFVYCAGAFRRQHHADARPRAWGLPAHVDRRLREEFGCQIRSGVEARKRRRPRSMRSM